MSGPTFCYNLGYAGFAKFQDYVMLATDGSFELTHNHMFTTGVYGGMLDNASAHVATAPDYPATSANIGFQLTSGSDFFTSLGNSITSNRFKWHQVTIYPNGSAGYNSKMYTQSLQYSTSQDSLVTGSVSFKGADVNSVLTDKQGGFQSADHKNGHGSKYLSSVTPGYYNVFPYYGTEWQFGDDAKGVKATHTYTASDLSKDIIAWSITASQQVSFIKVCNCSYQQVDQIKADFAILGLMQVNGNAQLIGINQRFKEGYMFYFIDQTSKIKMVSANGTKKRIQVPNMQCMSVSSRMQTGASLITTSFDFMVMGAKKSDGDNKPLIKFADGWGD